MHILVAELTYVVRQHLGRDALDRLLARWINIQYEKNVRIVERDNKIVHQLLRSRKSMRLKNNDRPPTAGTVLGSRKGRQDLGRMMPVIVNNSYAANLALELEPPVRVLKSFECLNDLVERNIQFHGD